MSYYVYILTNKRNGTLYVGVTGKILTRVKQHKEELVEGFTKKYHVHNLVHYEKYNDVMDALGREKELKHWKRQWKMALIEYENPDWDDLARDWEGKSWVSLYRPSRHEVTGSPVEAPGMTEIKKCRG